MKILKKPVTYLVLIIVCLGHGGVQAQSERANDNARENAARTGQQGGPNAQTNRNGNGGNGAMVVKEDGERARVTTPGRGRAVVSTPNRGRASGPENPGRFGPKPRVSPNAP